MNRDYIVRPSVKGDVETGEGRKVFEVPCHLCGVTVEREHQRTNAICFDCKKKRHAVATKKHQKNRGY